jgi:phage-related protein
LNPKQTKKITWTLELVGELQRVPASYLKKLEGSDEIWEIRTEFAGDAFRLLCFWDSGALIIVTNGFAKKNEKTPPREIALAEQRKKDYFCRKKIR